MKDFLHKQRNEKCGKRRLLLIEDSERLQELLSELLKNAGYNLEIIAGAAGLSSSVSAIIYLITPASPLIRRKLLI
jgi:hypothetical protein